MIIVLFALTTFLSTFFAMFHFVSSFKYRKEPVAPVKKNLGFSIIIPCFNEALILPNTIAGVLNIDYDPYEVIFVNDGSEDGTWNVLCSELELSEDDLSDIKAMGGVRSIRKSRKYDHVYAIDKKNSGKADSLNKGISLSHNELIVTLDGDCILDKASLKIMNQTFLDEEVVASGGAVHVMQSFLLGGKRKFIIGLQSLDFIKGFYIYKASLAYNNALSIISGAFGVFRKSALQAIEGFRNGLGEDIDITLRLQEYALIHDKRITYNQNAICYTECPEDLKNLSRQRTRWQKAFLDAVVNNRKFLVKYFFKANVCFFMIADALFSGTIAVISFFVNLVLMAAKLIYGFPFMFLLYFILTIIYHILCSIIAVGRAKRLSPELDSVYLCGMIFFELLCFSFLRIWFFVKGTISYFLNHMKWDKVERTSHSYHQLNNNEGG